MPEGRPAIPTALKRRVLMEAGHRCAIPTCRTVPVELAHITPYAEVRDHTFENLIALCPTCHTRFDRGDIDRPSMRGYKANLAVVNGRYGETERRVLDLLAANPEATQLRLPGGWDLQLWYLLKDGLLAKLQVPSLRIEGIAAAETYAVTEAGRAFLQHWVAADPVSAEAE
ncbi:HNH endonuclease [Streptomyces hokutonensis]|uniref:HNH endonuclease n=1 Tax=Streptomyces hokutonensis TaxID=1306990 RepID=UPI0038166ABC